MLTLKWQNAPADSRLTSYNILYYKTYYNDIKEGSQGNKFCVGLVRVTKPLNTGEHCLFFWWAILFSFSFILNMIISNHIFSSHLWWFWKSKTLHANANIPPTDAAFQCFPCKFTMKIESLKFSRQLFLKSIWPIYLEKNTHAGVKTCYHGYQIICMNIHV